MPAGTLMIRPVLLTTLFSLLVSCGRPQGSSCTTAVVKNKVDLTKAAFAKVYNIPNAIAGGYLTISKRETLSKPDIKTISCSAFVTFQGSDGDSFRLWSAQHCFRLGLIDDMTLHVYFDGAYHAIPIESKSLDSVKTIRSKIEVQNPVLLEDVTKLLHSGDDFRLKVRTTSLKACQAKDEKRSTACFTMYDLISFNASPSSTLSPETQGVLRSLRSQEKKLFSASDSALLARYQRGIDALMNSRNTSGIISFLTKLESCANGTKDAASCPGDYVSSGTEFARRFIDVESFKRDSVIKEVDGSNVRKFVVQDELAKWKEYFPKSISAYSEPLSEVWKVMDSPLFRATHPLLFATNVSTDGNPSFEWVPSFSSPETLGKAGSSARSYLFKSKSGRESVQFGPGDSGSILLLKGIPIATMSHKDGEETSGGASVINLPTRKKDKPQENSVRDDAPAEKSSSTSPERAPSSRRETTTRDGVSGGPSSGSTFNGSTTVEGAGSNPATEGAEASGSVPSVSPSHTEYEGSGSSVASNESEGRDVGPSLDGGQG